MTLFRLIPEEVFLMLTVELLYMLIDLLSSEVMLLRVIGKEITARTTGHTQTNKAEPIPCAPSRSEDA